MTRTKYQRNLNDVNSVVESLASIGEFVYRNIERPIISRAARFIDDNTSMPYNRKTFAGSLKYAAQPVAGEIGSWVATPEARHNTLRKAIIFAAAQAAIM